MKFKFLGYLSKQRGIFWRKLIDLNKELGYTRDVIDDTVSDLIKYPGFDGEKAYYRIEKQTERLEMALKQLQKLGESLKAVEKSTRKK